MSLLLDSGRGTMRKTKSFTGKAQVVDKNPHKIAEKAYGKKRKIISKKDNDDDSEDSVDDKSSDEILLMTTKLLRGN